MSFQVGVNMAKRDLFEYRRKVFPEIAEVLVAQTASLGPHGRRFGCQVEMPPTWGVRMYVATRSIRLESKRFNARSSEIGLRARRFGSGVDMGV